ncbi:3-isopropylmalate dehydrogenase, partial [Nostoc sp. CHAB 5834]|nr:3-isopropylmalate dehydrogenase [Nostoc sp. CHAB 5834]
LYEPIHGSAHDITGKGVANPLASVLSVALMLDISFGMKAEAEAVVQAVDTVLKAGFRTGDIAEASTPRKMILGTQAMGEQVLQALS